MIETYSYSGEGLEKSYLNDTWMVGIKNYKPASDVKYIEVLERHLLTDELFAPITQGNYLVYIEEDKPDELQIIRMEVGSVYNVKKGTWHNAVMPTDGKIILIERPDTSAENSEFRTLSSEQRTLILAVAN